MVAYRGFDYIMLISNLQSNPINTAAITNQLFFKSVKLKIAKKFGNPFREFK